VLKVDVSKPRKYKNDKAPRIAAAPLSITKTATRNITILGGVLKFVFSMAQNTKKLNDTIVSLQHTYPGNNFSLLPSCC
jgi:hypothetical protein